MYVATRAHTDTRPALTGRPHPDSRWDPSPLPVNEQPAWLKCLTGPLPRFLLTTQARVPPPPSLHLASGPLGAPRETQPPTSSGGPLVAPPPGLVTHLSLRTIFRGQKSPFDPHSSQTAHSEVFPPSAHLPRVESSVWLPAACSWGWECYTAGPGLTAHCLSMFKWSPYQI